MATCPTRRWCRVPMASSTAPTAPAGKTTTAPSSPSILVAATSPCSAPSRTPAEAAAPGAASSRRATAISTAPRTGGSNSYGVLYQVTPGGTLTYLDSFNNADPGANPVGTLIEGIDGYLYGTAQYGGLDNFGTVFRATVPGGVLSRRSRRSPAVSPAFTPRATSSRPRRQFLRHHVHHGRHVEQRHVFPVTAAGVYTVLYNFTGGHGRRRAVARGRPGRGTDISTASRPPAAIIPLGRSTASRSRARPHVHPPLHVSIPSSATAPRPTASSSRPPTATSTAPPPWAARVRSRHDLTG